MLACFCLYLYTPVVWWWWWKVLITYEYITFSIKYLVKCEWFDFLSFAQYNGKNIFSFSIFQFFFFFNSNKKISEIYILYFYILLGLGLFHIFFLLKSIYPNHIKINQQNIFLTSCQKKKKENSSNPKKKKLNFPNLVRYLYVHCTLYKKYGIDFLFIWINFFFCKM